MIVQNSAKVGCCRVFGGLQKCRPLFLLAVPTRGNAVWLTTECWLRSDRRAVMRRQVDCHLEINGRRAIRSLANWLPLRHGEFNRCARGGFSGVVDGGDSDADGGTGGQSGQCGIAIEDGRDRDEVCIDADHLFEDAIASRTRYVVPVGDYVAGVGSGNGDHVVGSIRDLSCGGRDETERGPARIVVLQQLAEFVDEAAHAAVQRGDGGCSAEPSSRRDWRSRC